MPAYSPQQVAHLFRAMAAYFEANPDEFKQVGVFRQSGSQTKAIEIVNGILDSSFIPSTSQYELNDYISAMKYVLNNSRLIADNDPMLQTLHDQFFRVNENDYDAGAQVLQDFIKNLAGSGDLNKVYFAEMLHTYARLMQLGKTHEQTNKMGAANLGTIFGFYLTNNTGLFSHAEAKSALSRINGCCARMIEKGDFSRSFAETYRAENVQAREQRMRQLMDEMMESSSAMNQTKSSVGKAADDFERLTKELQKFQKQIADLKSLSKKEVKHKGGKEVVQGDIDRLNKIVVTLQKQLGAINAQNLSVATTFRDATLRGTRLQSEMQSLTSSLGALGPQDLQQLAGGVDPSALARAAATAGPDSSSSSSPSRRKSVLLSRTSSSDSLSGSSPRDVASSPESSPKERRRKKKHGG